MNEDTNNSNNHNQVNDQNHEKGFVEITSEFETEATITVRIPVTNNQVPALAASLFYDTLREMKIGQSVSRIREVCYEKNGIYYSQDSKRAKMEQLIISVTANHPFGIRMDQLQSELNLDRKTASAYIGSANNWTSQFLRTEGEFVKSNLKGIEVVLEKIES